jgi:hypothetical protein
VDVDLVINCFERTYRDVLAAGFFDEVVAQNRFRFARRVVLINNVDDPADATRLAQARLDAGEVDAAWHVAERLPAALRRTRLGLRDLGAGTPHSTPSLVAVTLTGAPWLVYWDAEIRLCKPHDWISDALAEMSHDSRILVAAPRWSSPKLEPEVAESRRTFDLCLGFSDHVYLARRAELGRPIYSERCVVRRRYPLAHRGYTFEARLDAYMRHRRRFRALHRSVGYEHDDSSAGETYPALSLSDRARLVANRAVISAIRASPLRPRCCRTLERRDPAKAAWRGRRD